METNMSLNTAEHRLYFVSIEKKPIQYSVEM